MNLFNFYKRLPIFLQNILVSLQGAKLEKIRYGQEFNDILNFSIETDSCSKEQILKYKEENLRRILEYAYIHVPFYKKHFDSHGVKPEDFKCLSDLQKFPILTKEDVRNHLDKMVSDEFDVSKLVKYHTSGSTGKALDFYWTNRNIRYYMAMVWRGRARHGIHKGDCHLNFTGKLVCPLEQKRPPFWRYNKPLNQYMLNMQHITKEHTPAIVSFINNTDIKFFVGYPSIMCSLAHNIEELGLYVTNPPQYIFSSAEKMYENQKELLKRVYSGVQILEHYGFSEEAACADKCKEGVYHEAFELGHLELKNAQQTKTGKTGILLATGFQNLAMPFIRYEVGDTATFAYEGCSCGVKSQVILDIEGRNEDYIITPEGTYIMRMDYIFKETATIKECQIVQRELGKIIIRIVKREDYSVFTEDSMKKAVKELISPTLKVEFEYVDSIERTKAGKFRAIVSELKKSNNEL